VPKRSSPAENRGTKRCCLCALAPLREIS
jgi:hypothetical protein